MQEHTLDFARIIIHDDHLAEVIINEEVEMDTQMVDTYHDFLLAHLQAPFSLLINKLNVYSYTFEAQRNIATIPGIDHVAIVAYRQMTQISTETLIAIPKEKTWDSKIFALYEEALAWLRP